MTEEIRLLIKKKKDEFTNAHVSNPHMGDFMLIENAMLEGARIAMSTVVQGEQREGEKLEP